ncbi:MAG TPA: YbhB/YbcL family Raf kinase inhibitor-like protein [Candidatus Hydrogenedentes bacterium]|nr:YbhB/YbcL family Raf kinase inhibitor-like protein [Candidatus Hydrogenedentota bacterium]
MSLTVSSSAFQNGAAIPKQYTGDGPDVSPPLTWGAPPDGTKSFALICDDPDAPVGTWVHWVIYDIKPETRELPEGVPTQETLADGAKQGLNDFRKVGYGGPAPPRGKPHRYFFKLYALDAELGLKPRATKKDVERAMKGHVLADGQLMGTYQR